MTKRKHSKRALTFSLLSLLLCVSMLVGSTFAWFTDSASTGVNKIVAGNLDVDLVDENGNTLVGQTLEFKKAAGAENEPVLWEPGCTYELPAVYVQNKGSLALKYKIAITGIDGAAKLNEAIEWTIALGTETAPVKIDSEFELAANTNSGALTIKGHMKEEAGNEYQGLTIEGITITVYATQLDAEFDSFGNNYDENAKYDYEFVGADALTGESAKDLTGSILLTNLNADLTAEEPYLTIGDSTSNENQAYLANSGVKKITVNGGVINTAFKADIGVDHQTKGSINLAVPDNTTVVFKNMTINGHYNFSAGSVGYAKTANNLTLEFENCTFNGCWASYVSGLKNIKFTNCTFTLEGIDTVNTKDTNPLWLRSEQNNCTLTLENCTIYGNRPVKFGERGNNHTLNVTGCTFNLAATQYDINNNRPDRVTAVRFDEKVTTVNVKNNTMVSGHAFYQTGNAPYSNEGYDDAGNNNAKPTDTLWRVEY